MNKQVSLPPASLSSELPENLPPPKFQLGQYVRWCCVPSQDYGRIVGIVYGSEASVKAEGYHYAIALDASSPSYADGITSDWGFEEDLELIDPKRL
ncbi:hypothetical protein IFO70_31505 [Phormidium tenue FACHB-886]|nr:hypothetical protein [Phormidium tenue FACHB-886]